MITLLILGAGELGAQVALAARRDQDVHVLVFASYEGAPAQAFAHTCIVADLAHHDTLLWLLHEHNPDRVLPELEGISLSALRTWCDTRQDDPVIPSLLAVETTMDRWAAHLMMAQLGIPGARRVLTKNGADIEQALAHMKGQRLVYKPLHTSSGEGQIIFDQADAEDPGFMAITRLIAQGMRPGMIEAFIQVKREWTVLALQTEGGLSLLWPLAHRQLHGDWVESWFETHPEPRHVETAAQIAHTVCLALGGWGLFALEFFITLDGTLLLNEVAARPHDTGFVTLALEGGNDQFHLCLQAAKGDPTCWPTTLPQAAARPIRSPAPHQRPALLAQREVPGAQVIDFGKPRASVGRRLGVVVARGEGARVKALAQSMAVCIMSDTIRT